MSDYIKEYTPQVEELFIQFFLSDPELFVRCRNVIKSDHYASETNKKTVDFMVKYADEYSALPDLDQLKAVVGKQFNVTKDLQDEHKEWFLDNYEKFARHKEIIKAVLDAPRLIEKKEYGSVEQLVKEAVQVGLVKDLGTDYFDDPLGRLRRMKEKKPLVSTGYRDLDHALFGGVEVGSLNIYAGQSGTGKSIFLQNSARKSVMRGENAMYISLELSEDLCALRLDAMFAGLSTQNVMRDSEDASTRIAMFAKKYGGSLQIKRFPSGTTAAEIRAYVKEYQIQTGRKVNKLCVDYLDLCSPYRTKVNASDVFTKDKYVSEELRDLAAELDVVLDTASQLNRDSHEAVDFGHQHIAGGVSKINTADNVFGIYVTNTMKENGRYQLQLLKTRSSSGVGKRIDLKYNPATMQMDDLEEGERGSIETQTSSILDSINKKGTMGKEPPAPTQDASSTVDAFSKVRNSLRRSD